MVVVIIMGVLSVLLFLCISNFVVSLKHINPAARRSSNLEQKQSKSAPLPAHRFRFVTLRQGVIKAIGAAFGGRPSGRKVTDRAAIAFMTSRILHGFGGLIRPRTLR